jgi:hypothetical protein
LLYIQETKEKCNFALNIQVNTHNTRNNNYHRHVHNQELYNGKPSEVGCIVYNKLRNNIKQIGINNNQFKKGTECHTY